MKRDEEKTNDSIPEPEKMIGEEIKELKNAQDSSENGIIADSNL